MWIIANEMHWSQAIYRSKRDIKLENSVKGKRVWMEREIGITFHKLLEIVAILLVLDAIHESVYGLGNGN